MSVNDQSQLVESPQNLPLLPLKDIVVFPHMIVPVFINEDLCINAVDNAVANSRKIFLSAFKVAGEEGDGLECSLEAPFDVYTIGTVCTVMRTRKLPDGRMKVLVQGLYKAKVSELISSENFPLVHVQPHTDSKMAGSTAELEALVRAVRENLEKVVSLGKVLSPDILMILDDVSDPARLSDLVASNLGLKVVDAQKILAVQSPLDRLQKVHQYLSREIEVYQMQVRIQSQAKEEIGRMQREHYLREQMKVIKTELGDTDGKDELDALWKKLEASKVTDEAREEVTRQLRRLERMHADTSEAALTRTHVEAILSLPWGKKSEEMLDLAKTKEILDSDHYGLDQVKDRLIEFLAVKKLNPKAKSPILCFVGPPGVGKTSLGKSIAKSMGRAFSRIALGGVRDEAEVRGHRKTYVGAYPGRVMASIKQAQTSNPVIMLDEIDKLGSDHRGDPSSALLEVLDPEQNKNFVDHYLGISFDLSDVTFIANANTLDTIPAPLRDRLEIIEVSGYSEEEKLIISNQFIIPKLIKEMGLADANIVFSKPSVTSVINGYTRESGLRSLEKQLANVCRKLAREFAEKGALTGAEGEKGQFKLTPALISKHLGVSKFGDNFYHQEAMKGVSLGLAYTQYGGEVLAIETNLLPSNGSKLVLTGQLGDVMKESAHAAFSFIKSRCEQFGIDPAILEKNEIHVHIPAGAVPKDGPSAGITLATSMLSALLGKAPAAKVAMTGEITLHGMVLPIGGLREKLLAAQREGIEMVIAPIKNRQNFDVLPASIKKKIKMEFVKNYFEVFEIMFAKSMPTAKPVPLKNLKSVGRRKQEDLAS
ncbi:MAG: endopeptidase La [Proteobacteria bacterium]|nr:endopeptidase La [Pseudomonadota bacterium]